jgi:hypothetical protein
MSCSGSHLGILINIKNTKFVKDLPMIDAQLRFNQCNSFREENISVFPHMVLKMTATAGLSLTLDPMEKMFQNASSLKPLGQLKPNCPGMIIGRFSKKLGLKKNRGSQEPVIKRTNWSYVKTMSCSGSHLGILINIKNTKFVKDLPMIDAQLRFNQCNSLCSNAFFSETTNTHV